MSRRSTIVGWGILILLLPACAGPGRRNASTVSPSTYAMLGQSGLPIYGEPRGLPPQSPEQAAAAQRQLATAPSPGEKRYQFTRPPVDPSVPVSAAPRELPVKLTAEPEAKVATRPSPLPAETPSLEPIREGQRTDDDGSLKKIATTKQSTVTEGPSLAPKPPPNETNDQPTDALPPLAEPATIATAQPKPTLQAPRGAPATDTPTEPSANVVAPEWPTISPSATVRPPASLAFPVRQAVEPAPRSPLEEIKAPPYPTLQPVRAVPIGPTIEPTIEPVVKQVPVQPVVKPLPVEPAEKQSPIEPVVKQVPVEAMVKPLLEPAPPKLVEQPRPEPAQPKLVPEPMTVQDQRETIREIVKETLKELPVVEPRRETPTPTPPVAAPTPPESPLVLAIRAYQAKDVAGAVAHLKQFDAKNQELLLSLMPLLVRLGEGSVSAMTPEELAQHLEQLQGASSALKSRAALKAETVCFCKRVLKYGKYEAVELDHLYQSSEPVEVYFELRNFTWDSNQSGDKAFAMRLGSTLEIRDSRKQVVWRRDLTTTDSRQSPPSDYYLVYRFTLPELPPGAYTLEVQVVDQLDTQRRNVRRSLDLQMGSKQ